MSEPPPRPRVARNPLSAYLSHRFGELSRRLGGRLSEQAADFSAAIQFCPDCQQRCPGLAHCYHLCPEPEAEAHDPDASPPQRTAF